MKKNYILVLQTICDSCIYGKRISRKDKPSLYEYLKTKSVFCYCGKKQGTYTDICECPLYRNKTVRR